MSVMVDPIVVLALRAGVALLFAGAAWHKLRDPARFRATLAEYRLLPGAGVAPAAVGVVVAEGAIVGAVAMPATAPAGLAAAAVALGAYAVAIAINLGRGRHAIDCGCLGAAGREAISWGLVGRNLVAATAALVGCLPIAARPLVWIDAVTAVAAVVFAALLWVGADGLLANGPAMRRVRSAA